MSFTLTKPGGWAFGEILTSAQVEDLDLKTANSVDGVGGGTYSPTSQISIGGKGLAVTGPLNVSGTATLTGNVSIGNGGGDTLEVDAEVTFSQDIEFNNDVRLGESATDEINVDGVLTCSREATFEDGVDITGNVAVTGDVDVTGAVGVSGDLAVGDDLTVADNATITGTLTAQNHTVLGSSSADNLTINSRLVTALLFEGSGRVGLRRHNLTSGSSETVTVADGNAFRIPVAASETDPSTYTLSNSGASDGDFAIFYSGTGNGTLNRNIHFVLGSTASGSVSAPSDSIFRIYIFEDDHWQRALSLGN